ERLGIVEKKDHGFVVPNGETVNEPRRDLRIVVQCGDEHESGQDGRQEQLLTSRIGTSNWVSARLLLCNIRTGAGFLSISQDPYPLLSFGVQFCRGRKDWGLVCSARGATPLRESSSLFPCARQAPSLWRSAARLRSRPAGRRSSGSSRITGPD